ncbi:unnamed protein product [Clonostachys solani]|uniref:Uncharacterized protein n=1 Tax=Clonostachys solani TaxID=160281 RepID=A0A9N9VXH5_9HYPO|nr:unnamed protein product [Clonostachys solani]
MDVRPNPVIIAKFCGPSHSSAPDDDIKISIYLARANDSLQTSLNLPRSKREYEARRQNEMAPLGIRQSQGEGRAHDPTDTASTIINSHPRDASSVSTSLSSNLSDIREARIDPSDRITSVHLSRRSSDEGTIIGIVVAVVVLLVLIFILTIHFRYHKGGQKADKSKKVEKEKEKKKKKKEKEKKEKEEEEERMEEEKAKRKKRRRERRKETEEKIAKLEKHQWREKERKRMKMRYSGDTHIFGGPFSQPMMVPVDGQGHPHPYSVPAAMDAPQDLPPDAVYYPDINYHPLPASMFRFCRGVPPGGSRMPAESPICTDFNCSGSSNSTEDGS